MTVYEFVNAMIEANETRFEFWNSNNDNDTKPFLSCDCADDIPWRVEDYDIDSWSVTINNRMYITDAQTLTCTISIAYEEDDEYDF